jgi:hypothetical protein
VAAAFRNEVVELEAEQQSLYLLLRHRTMLVLLAPLQRPALLVLLAPPVPGHPPRLVHIQNKDYEQHHCGAKTQWTSVLPSARRSSLVVLGSAALCLAK